MIVQALVHVGYALMLCALLARDILWLRLLLVGAQSLIAAYAIAHGVIAIGAWNALFVLINSIWVVLILRERRAVRLPDELRALYERYFAALTPPEFLRLWGWAREEACDGAVLTRAGERPQALYFLLDGSVSVRSNEQELARLGRGAFVGEMSLLTGGAATADSVALGRVAARVWPVSRLQALRARDPGLWTRVQSVLGRDIVEKIQRSAGVGSLSPASPTPDGAASSSPSAPVVG